MRATTLPRVPGLYAFATIAALSWPVVVTLSVDANAQQVANTAPPVVDYERNADSPVPSAAVPKPVAADRETAMTETPKVNYGSDSDAGATDGGAAPAVAVPTDVHPVIDVVRSLLNAEEGNVARGHKDDIAGARAFYEAREAGPLWVDDVGLNSRAKAVTAEMSKADSWGLDPAAFNPPSGSTTGLESIATAEIEMTMAVLTYARHARGGRIENPTKMLSSYIDRKPQLKPVAEVLGDVANASEPDAYLRGLHPQHEQFRKLREHLLALRRGVEEREDVVRIPNSGPLLSRGKSHPHVALLRERLGVSTPDAGDREKPAEYFDEALEAAVKAFQKDNGLSQDGVVGPGTRAAFNGGSAEINEEMLIANMEAWRWMPDDLGDIHVITNVPEFRMRVVKNGEVIHSERIIAGKTDKQTPVFSDVMETIVFHPFWGVPNSIKVNEILPSLARSGGVLNKHNLRIQHGGRDIDPRNVDWSTADIRRFHVYQPPGRGNVLGVVKFMFPNKHQVYMHDTPTKNLFKSRVRTFSHGCMRVRDPVRLAEILLEADRGWPESRVASLVKGGPQNNNVKLNRKIPVHVTYFTAYVDEDGELKAVGDVYGHEKRIKLALAGKWDKIARGRDHLAPVKINRAKLKKYAQPDPVQELFNAVFGF